MRATWLPLIVLAVLAAGHPTRGAQPTPVIVELFTSEGCSSCPPADTLLRALTDEQPVAGTQIIGLGLHVDYWDHQGWKDRFGSASFTQRQKGYQARFDTESVYTPQMVVDGRAEFVGSDAAAAQRAIARASAAPHGTVRIAVDTAGADRVAVTVTASDMPAATALPADIMIAVIEDQLKSDVKRGENKGRALAHAAVVRLLKPIGETTVRSDASARGEIALARDWQRDRLKLVAFVQERRGRTIAASAVAPLLPGR